MNFYLNVMDEFDTIAMALEGMNLARCGDGEAKIASGFGYSREPPNDKLRCEMAELMFEPKPGCLTCIPTFDPQGVKYANWTRHEARFRRLCDQFRTYGSAFVSRPDSAQWIATKAYAVQVQNLWMNKRAVIVCERKGSMFGTVRMTAKKAKHIECPHSLAYAQIDALERAVIDAQPEIAILSAGPTATCLANRLAKKVHAIDLGSAGRFIARMLEQS